MGHFHGHDHLNHDHSHHKSIYKASEKRHLVTAIIVNGIVMLLEFAGGLISGSLALLSDAGHMFTHIFALSTSLAAILLASRGFNDRKSYGYFRAEILATFVNSLFLFFAVIWIAYEAISRILHPSVIHVAEMIAIALIGLAANMVSFFILKEDSEKDINIRSAFLHVLSDTLSSVFIIIGGILIYFKGWVLIDPLLSLGISLLILLWAWRLLRESVNILLEATPKDVHVRNVRKKLLAEVKGLKDLHDIHIWVITGHLYAATLHVFLENMTIKESGAVIARIRDILEHDFNITHATIQVDAEEEDCTHREGIGACSPSH